jgi:hypothetical protein
VRGLQARLTATEAQGRSPASRGAAGGGTFDDAQLARLQEAAEGCRISRAMKVPVEARRAPGAR